MELLNSILSLRHIEYLIIDENLNIREMSLKVNRFADIPEKVTPGEDIRIAFPELIGIEEVLEAIKQGKQNDFELKGIKRSPNSVTNLYIDFYLARNPIDNPSRNEFLILLEDITERMLLEQSLVQSINEANLLLRKLTASKQYIDQIITSMADALVVTTPSGKIKTINPAAQALLEYNETELQGQPISTVIRGVENWHREEGEQEVETICQTKTGKTVHVAFSCSIIQTEVDNFQGFVYILRDMTERKQIELAKQEFLAMISHEVRTPMASVIGIASLLLDTALTAQQKEFVKTIYSSGKGLLKIINDIVDFSKIESGKLELEEQPLNLRDSVADALDLLLPEATEKGLKLSLIDTQALNTIILGDITRLRQILVNLVSNAIKFTQTGSIEVSVIIGDRTSEKNEIQFTVKDTGIGIPRDRLDRLFKTFSQVNSSITRQYGGTGLGLAICKQLCELMGGRIWVESEPGVGSTFYFTITVLVIAETVESQNLVVDETQTLNQISEEHPLRILLVEDHVINQRMIRLMLQKMGYQPDVANNGLEALLALRRQPYDVVLMDMQMPHMDGLTATQQIREEWPPEACPRIIALTASVMKGDRDHCLASGMDDYLTKPISIQELAQVLKRCQPLFGDAGTRGCEDVGNQEDTGTRGCGEVDQEFSASSINPNTLQEILQMSESNSSVDAVEFLREIIDCYLEDSPRLLQEIQIYWSQTNLKDLRRAAHTFASSSATLGATALANLCAKLEQTIANDSLIGIETQISAIQTEYQQVEIALQQERQKYSIL